MVVEAVVGWVLRGCRGLHMIRAMNQLPEGCRHEWDLCGHE